MNENQRKICTEIWQEHESQLRKICKIKLQSHPNEIDDVMSEVSLALNIGNYINLKKNKKV
mgnify:CR=1 FL=1